jgi:hypothetical protein
MLKIINSKGNYRSLSQIFTPANFKRVIKSEDYFDIESRIKTHVNNFETRSYSDLLEFAYKKLELNYRNEYIYKNALINEKLIKSYGLKDTTVLNEFKISQSIADFVLLNGEVKVFEIKTDLDSFEKLSKQIEDYQKFANKIYIVVSSKNIIKIADVYKNTSIGIIEYTNKKKLTTIKEAENNISNFDYEVIFKTLRKQEYLDIIFNYFGFVPDVPNTKIFKKCFEMAKEIDIVEFQKLVYKKIKQRKLKCPDILDSEQIPNELKHICYTLNLSVTEYNKLFKFLNTTI